MKPLPVSRRQVLKSIGLIGLGAAAMLGPDPLDKLLSAKAQTPQEAGFRLPPRWEGQPLGRITGAFMNARAEPSTDAEIVTQLLQDDLVRVRGVVQGQTVWLHNDQWLETAQGYLYSSFVQPIHAHLPNPPATSREIGAGRWAELTAPYSDAYWDTEATGKASDLYVGRMYYGTTHRVTDVQTGKDGRTWYRIKELYGAYWMRATHLRLIPEDELAPLSPELAPDEKRLTVDLTRQMLTAYEGDNIVFQHYVSTGRPGKDTPEGIHYVVDKRISERMVGGSAADEEDSSRYNLAGVPYVCYFTWDWVATHGCYWHNDYGQVRSSGCVNLPAAAARWLWRWTTPTPPSTLDDFYYRVDNALEGTRVDVFYS